MVEKKRKNANKKERKKNISKKNMLAYFYSGGGFIHPRVWRSLFSRGVLIVCEHD